MKVSDRYSVLEDLLRRYKPGPILKFNLIKHYGPIVAERSGRDPRTMSCAEIVSALCEPTPAIRTSHVFPPIPTRNTDWCAYYDGREEAGPYGWGPTEAAAIADLIDNTEESNQ